MKVLILFFTVLITLNINAQQRSFIPIDTKSIVEKRLALVIGNANYQGNPLTNPLNDAKAISTVLQELGFTVQYYENLGKIAMEAALMRFAKALHKHNVGLFYFAGHGFESKDKVNYLMSTDINSSVNEALAKDKSLNLDVVMQSMQDANTNSNLLVIDACRNNPFRSWSRDGAKGLGSVNPALGTVLFFAASAGQAADDNRGSKNGLFTEEFLSQIRKPNLELSDILKNTSRAVYKRSGGQMPAISGNLLEDFYFLRTVKNNIETSEKETTTKVTLNDADMLENGIEAWQANRYADAKSWFESSADLNNKEAMNYLGTMYEQGEGVTKNIKTAKIWYEVAYTLGSSNAGENLNRLNNKDEKANGRETLTFNSFVHDFGAVKEGMQATGSFEFTNNSNQTISIDNVIPSCSCVVTNWSHFVLPGEAGYIKVTFNSTGRLGNFNKNLTVITDKGETIALTLKGNVIK